MLCRHCNTILAVNQETRTEVFHKAVVFLRLKINLLAKPFKKDVAKCGVHGKKDWNKVVQEVGRHIRSSGVPKR
ncbi:hypothetical protein BCR33DRAFT_718067 [Rhizoclosmatium globosum]|uniref:Uncharacterized protein n=1 Tax=Rhizoclosmatium globosum TaxID=329046 RepID=A0A1Y2C746_9FUNG|nr:hypothetical protein BCR33DRAFT_727178 [Rhizoclosmatium globosum]ORY25110.1 hypothetical protein BCR33DRAFT_727191 [Rhizoclosmatium globosum]ORY42849.1 hypothetical protein BCR33DRAFT_718065 [Rhizoclosmatium globosum]ORY42852.1 hypothetical protein BCR33DRAFT_718067 [Rhizoclosmatium globosum]|eukprot:ORY25107.1 hypothetical protein BCR33DRAFT_727178 [Rhizoclosmatium globosum]